MAGIELATVEELVARVGAPDGDARAEAAWRLDGKSKPPGSLGRIEEVAIRLAGIFGTPDFETSPRAVVVMAADHGVVAQGVSAYPQGVTAAMVHNFAAGGAAVNVLARMMAVDTRVVDMGVAGESEWPPPVERRRLGAGTADMTGGPAMSDEQARQGVLAGAAIAAGLVEEGARVVLTGEMGIGNTTAAAAVTAAMTGRDPAAVTGPGTGVRDQALARKVDAVRRALERNEPVGDRPLEVLARVGGFEIAGLAGLILGAAANRVPVLLDGFIAGAAALVAAALSPGAVDFMIAGHRSAEPGHRIVLEGLGLDPLVDLGMRLGEGTGALMALPVLDAAARILHDMATMADVTRFAHPGSSPLRK